MTNFRVTVSYDGTDYVGWQRQASGVSIQGLLEEALQALDGAHVTVSGAGRTDAGVHAIGQVAGFTLERSIEPAALVRALNAHLPYAVRVLAADEVEPGFHPRFSARAKTYRYRMWNGEVMNPFERAYAWHLRGRLDVDAMLAAARLLEGHHDFAAFQAAGSDVATTERDITSSLVLRQAQDVRAGQDDRSLVVSPSNHEPLIVYEVTGSGFLRHMVRIIVGTLVEIGRGRQPIEWMSEAIASRSREAAGPTAPPHGLVLMRVEYAASALAAGS